MRAITMFAIWTSLSTLSGCSNLPKENAECVNRKFDTSVQRAICLNGAEPLSVSLAFRGELERARLALAEEVDAKQITQAEADSEFANYRKSIEERDRLNDLQWSAARAAMIGARIR
ncbi:hypothetical protein [Microvirga alba]|uniref:Uncharacterized protein n=1 Tax=Microvirga alba TaxID=2791025 RepID=A0A931BPS2_9HYPH|nr:hypothetical protein [Microvirga alba]MBF9232323.1 hypothetical protein [Microvirga alba]